jgi:hypothetical protein
VHVTERLTTNYQTSQQSFFYSEPKTMSITLIVILIVTVSLILGPLAMMRPDPVQKQKENLRLMARQHGVHYSIRNLPKQADEQQAPDPSPVYFSPPNETQNSPSWMLVRTSYAHDVNFLQWWAWQGEARASSAELAVLNQHLPALPDSIRALSAGGKGVCVYWNEKGGEPTLKQILGLIDALKQAA